MSQTNAGQPPQPQLHVEVAPSQAGRRSPARQDPRAGYLRKGSDQQSYPGQARRAPWTQKNLLDRV